MTNLTNAQLDRIATMNAADAASWALWYGEQNAVEATEQAATEKAILAAVIERGGEAEPVVVRKVVAVPALTFNRAVRFLKYCGALSVDEAGLMVA